MNANKVGAPPGSLTYHGPPGVGTKIFDLYYSSESLGTEPYLETNHWIEVRGLEDVASIVVLKDKYCLHRLCVEDILSLSQRPKIECRENYLFITTITKDNEQVSFVLLPQYNVLLSFQPNLEDIFEPVRERLAQSGSHIRSSGLDYLLWALMDIIVDNYFPLVQRWTDELSEMDALAFNNTSPSLRSIQSHRSKSYAFLVSTRSMRDIAAELKENCRPFILEGTHGYFCDLHDHLLILTQDFEFLLQGNRDLLDFINNDSSMRQQKQMNQLTILMSIFVPLSFLTGWFGMNIPLPYITEPWVLPDFILFCLLLTLCQMLYFRRMGKRMHSKNM
jgi:magnesium transporter